MKVKALVVLAVAGILTGCNATSDKLYTEKTRLASPKMAKGVPGEYNLTELDLLRTAKRLGVPYETALAAAEDIGYECKIERVTGSHLRKKLCTTEHQRILRAKAAHRTLKNNLTFLGIVFQ